MPAACESGRVEQGLATGKIQRIRRRPPLPRCAAPSRRAFHRADGESHLGKQLVSEGNAEQAAGLVEDAHVEAGQAGFRDGQTVLDELERGVVVGSAAAIMRSAVP